VEKVGGKSVQKTRRGRCMAERRGMLERSGSPSKSRLHHHYETTTVQKLGEDFLASFISSFW